MSHTPGPLVVRDRFYVLTADHEQLVADATCDGRLEDEGRDDELAANALLWAAAPDLLAALRVFAEGNHLDSCALVNPDDARLYCTCGVTAARAAITKATGVACR